ncbi:adenine deaminase [Sedimentibacter sp. zth1]|uniref:adenine deaminase n=1 Tax=Sedimentibacter sp. zth1 TaxID=2816908 RepID=UPI001A9140CA|nr:adenine deaminase [Sedimentibacter sp. zth1]QSX07393.1 adenine deaminase [Sedimentibacter sp. zth1]
MGITKADMVIKNVKLINVNTKEIIEHVDIAIKKGRIALVGDASHTIGKNTKIIDGTPYFATPGFIDTHIHVESSMITVKEYAKCVIKHGTTTIYMDPHEIANVLGLEGIKLMIEDGYDIPLRVYSTVPSCVPACPGFEDTGATLSSKDIKKALKFRNVKGLGEMMNYPGVIYGDTEVHKSIASTLKDKKIATGHYSNSEVKGLNAYISTGINCCHESVSKEDAINKLRLGMYVQMREGSAWHDVKETVRSITENNIDSRFAVLVSDDTHPYTLINDGHLDHIIKRAIEEGVDELTAIQMATLNAATCFGMQNDLGSISPGKWADINLISNLKTVNVDKVIFNGELVVDNKELLVNVENIKYPDFSKNTMNIKNPLKPNDFKICADGMSKNVRIMEIIEAKVPTIQRFFDMQVIDNEIKSDIERDLIKIAVVERHKKTGLIGKGFVKGFGFKSGAVASTVAHDAHNLMIIGTNDDDMALAGNKLAECGGGMIVVENGKVIAINPLPIAGLMSEDNVEIVAKRVHEIELGWKKLGCNLISPFMTSALLALAVIPELRLTNKGYIDTVNFKSVSIFK